jgi:putative acetyltransferase
MSTTLTLRVAHAHEFSTLRALLHAAVHQLGSRHYSAAQCAAWAPEQYDAAAWQQRLAANPPWVACRGDTLAGFIDLHPDGLIDLCFVHPQFTGRGVGSLLLQHVLAQAAARALPHLYANVSLSAEALFARHGFVVTQRQNVSLRGQTFANARMERPIP